MNKEQIREEIADYLAKWFDKGRDWGKQNIDKPTLFNLESDSTQILSIKGIRIEADNQNLASWVSFQLGILNVEVGNLFENYPNNFNLTMKRLEDELKKKGWVKCKVKEEQ